VRHTVSFSLPPPPLPLSCTWDQWGCVVISSLSSSLYSPEQQALNQTRQKAHWDLTAGACLSRMCHNTGVLSWGVQPSSLPSPSFSNMGENMKTDMTQRTDCFKLMWQKKKAGGRVYVSMCAHVFKTMRV